ncbi:low-density lipoprotein receptor-related protein 8 isoform X1 [Hydra vulgaris]|uniref:Low-density lipoprotein receptor-related protein 8 isoform X1 n=1 Tax=Hydra vulgaris TaxID=6087 RepID=A0ABM4C768_HYDVU
MKGSKTLLSYILFIIGLQWKSVAALPACHDDEFKCKNGTCLSLSSMCDDVDDCGDNSDEERCVAEKNNKVCPVENGATQFRCKNNLCVSVAKMCDGYDDCGDSSDESPTGGAKCVSIKCRNSDDFRCETNPVCISRYYRCDGTFECEDHSDEANCESVKCSADEFQCLNKMRCISNSLRCDFRYDCDDKSDEVECNLHNATCPNGSFSCKGSNHCLDNSLKCNGVRNCPDNSDELNCPKSTEKCANDEFKCLSNGICIKKTYRCDTVDDCSDGSDEMDCLNNKCEKDQFRCDNGQCVSNVFAGEWKAQCHDKLKFKQRKRRDAIKSQPKVGSLVMSTGNLTTSETNMQNDSCLLFCPTNKECLSRAFLCDNENDCPDGYDELSSTCESISCNKDEFKCANGKCEKKKQVCDGIDDCGDNSDEADELCSPTAAPVSCNNDSYQCKNESKCIPMTSVCNSIKDCANGDDEDNLCDVKECDNENGGCSYKCKELKLGYECLCPQGFQLDSDKKSCIDIDECKEGWNVSKCSQICTNLNGTYKCSCHNGFNLVNKKCRANGSVADLIFANELDVRILQSNSQHYRKFADAYNANAVAVDVLTEMIYWSDFVKGTISCASRSNFNPKVIISGLKKPRSLAVDWIGRKLYWIDTAFNNISVSNLDGSFPKTIVKGNGFEEFSGLAIHPYEGYLFWTDVATNGKVVRSNLLGTSQTTIASDLGMPMGIAVDIESNKVYWSDMHLHHICSVNLDGSGFNRILKNIESPLSIAMFEDEIYWTSKVGKKIYRANKFDGTEKSEYNASFLSPMDVVVYHSSAQFYLPHPCNINNGNCSHLCLVQNLTTGICACPDGMNIDINMKSCVSAVKTQVDKDIFQNKSDPISVCNGYQCHSSSKCIEKLFVCDGVTHCPEHDDETSCKSDYSNVSEINNEVTTATSGNNKSFIIGAALGSIFLLLIFFVVFIYLLRKKRSRFDLSMVYETESDIVYGKDGYDNDLQLVIGNQIKETKQSWSSKQKTIEVAAYDEAKIPLTDKNKDENCFEDSSSGEVCFDDDRQPIIANIV